MIQMMIQNERPQGDTPAWVLRHLGLLAREFPLGSHQPVFTLITSPW